MFCAGSFDNDGTELSDYGRNPFTVNRTGPGVYIITMATARPTGFKYCVSVTQSSAWHTRVQAYGDNTFTIYVYDHPGISVDDRISFSIS